MKPYGATEGMFKKEITEYLPMNLNVDTGGIVLETQQEGVAMGIPLVGA